MSTVPEAYAEVLPRAFYEGGDVVALARKLLGQWLCSRSGGAFTAGRIVETEAYDHARDRACHAYLGRNTRRTQTMFMAGGTAYVYLCYGIHHLLNVVANPEGSPDAVLIRAVAPQAGLETMLARRRMDKHKPTVTAGPACLTQAMGITTALDRCDLTDPGASPIWIARGTVAPEAEIATGPRVGIDYAGEDAALPWRFWERANRYVSKAK